MRLHPQDPPKSRFFQRVQTPLLSRTPLRTWVPLISNWRQGQLENSPLSSFGRYHGISLEVHMIVGCTYLVDIVVSGSTPAFHFFPAAFMLSFTWSTATRVSPLAAFLLRYHSTSKSTITFATLRTEQHTCFPLGPTFCIP